VSAGIFADDERRTRARPTLLGLSNGLGVGQDSPGDGQIVMAAHSGSWPAIAFGPEVWNRCLCEGAKNA
jgi:hypothetical protein